LEERNCCDEDILDKRRRALEREDERRWKEKISNSEIWKKKGVGEWTEHCVVFKHTDIEATS